MMKRFFYLIALVALVALTGCDKTPKTVNLLLAIDQSGLDSGVPTPDKYHITVTNTNTSEVLETDSQNLSAAFVVGSGIYSVLVEGASSKDGIVYTISGSDRVTVVTANGDVNTTVKVSAAEATALIFKEVYYTGVGDYYFRDQFYEIYNNSDQTVYADGLCIADVDTYDWDGTPLEYDIENQDSYVFSQQVWQVPGNGTQYPVAPGESIVIAQWATNHGTEELAGSLGKDLTGAEFEAIVGESTLWNGTVITDNPAINMRHYASAYDLPQWLTSVGGSGLILFFPPDGMDPTNLTYQTGSSSIYGAALAIPVTCIIDGINTIEDAASSNMHNVPTSVDAGYIFCSGIYTNESIVRKVAETKDGRPVYKDTNNSSADFEVSTLPKIRRNGEGVPSWNTWNN